MTSRTTSATAHPAVPTQMTTWSFASSGGGGAGRAARSRVRFIRLPLPTPPGYDRAGNRDVLSPRQGLPTKVTDDDSNADQDRCRAGHGSPDLREQAGAAAARAAHHVGHDRGGAVRDSAGRAVRPGSAPGDDPRRARRAREGAAALDDPRHRRARGAQPGAPLAAPDRPAG